MADTLIPNRSHADILFGDPPSNTVPVPTPADSAPRRSAEDVLFGETTGMTAAPLAGPAHPPTPRRSHAEILFGDVELDLGLEDNMRTIADVEGLTTAQQAAELREFATVVMHDVGLERPDARLLHEVYTKRRLAGDSDEWVAQAHEWAKTSRRQLRERYGAEQAEVLLTQLDAYAVAHPALQEILAGGVGAHPDVVAMFAEHVRRVGH